MKEAITDKELISFLKRNKKIKETLGTGQPHETFYSRNIKTEALRDVSYDRETKRLSLTFVPPERGVVVKHEMRLKCASPPMLQEIVTFLSYRNGGVQIAQEKV